MGTRRRREELIGGDRRGNRRYFLTEIPRLAAKKRPPSWPHGELFDHVAISDEVVRCDIGEGVPLDDVEIDVAVFSLSLMGANSGDYLREAARTLVFDGRLIICEASSRLPADDDIQKRLERLGFHITDISRDAQFTFIQAIRTDREPEIGVSLV